VSHERGDAVALDVVALRLRGGRCSGAASACVKQGDVAALRQHKGGMCAVALHLHP